MKTTVKNLTDTKVELTIAVDKDALADARQVALTKLAKDVKVPGFRKGKTPVHVAEKHVDPQLLEHETLDNALSKAVAESFIAEGLQAIERPEVEVKKYVPGEELEFTATTEIIPPVTLGDYKKLKATKEAVKVAANEVDEIITRMQDGFATKEDVKRAAQDGDEVIIDFVGKKDDVAFDGGTAKDYALTLGSNSFIPGFEEGIVGKNIGDSFDLDLAFPDDYHAAELKGQKVVFSVTLNAIKERKLPELNDEFAAKAGPFTSMDELKADIEREITEQKEREAGEKLKDELVSQLIEKSKVPVPEVLVNDQAQSIEQDFTQNLMYRGMTIDQYIAAQGFKDKEEWLEKEVKATATKRVQAGLVLAELSKVEKIEASADELAEHIERYRSQYASNPEILKQFDSPEVHRDIANRLITEKTVDRLVELNTK